MGTVLTIKAVMYEADDRPLTEGDLTLTGTVIRLADLILDYIRATPLRDYPIG